MPIDPQRPRRVPSQPSSSETRSPNTCLRRRTAAANAASQTSSTPPNDTLSNARVTRIRARLMNASAPDHGPVLAAPTRVPPSPSNPLTAADFSFLMPLVHGSQEQPQMAVRIMFVMEGPDGQVTQTGTLDPAAWINELFSIVQQAQQRPGRLDIENVMRGNRIDSTRASIVALRKQVFLPLRGEAALRRITEDLESMRDGKVATPPSLAQERLGVSEVNNALRTLHAVPAENDRTPPLISNPSFLLEETDEGEDAIGLADLVGLALGAIEQYENPQGDEATQRDRFIMREGLDLGIARCIDTDEESSANVAAELTFRVCEVGITQHIISPLQKFFACVRIDSNENDEPITNPGELLSSFAREFVGDLEGKDASQGELNAFFDKAKKRAREFWADDSAECERFDHDLEQYLEGDHAWERPQGTQPNTAL